MTPEYTPTVRDGDAVADAAGRTWYARDVDHLIGSVCWSLAPGGRVAGCSLRDPVETTRVWAVGA